MATRRVKKTIRVQFITAPGCSECAAAKRVISDFQNKFPTLNLRVEEVDITSLKGLELAVKHSVMSNPGIIINDELFSSGYLDPEKFTSKILSL